MSMIQSDLLLGQEGGAGYVVQRSVRFNSSDSAYLSRTFSSPTNNIKWTWCGWVKRSKLSTDYRTLFNGNSISTNYASIEFSDTDNIRVYNRPSSAGGVTAIRTTSAVFRDTSAWYHIMVAWDSANATAADRLILYVNGTRVTAFSSSTDPTSSEASVINSAIDHGIGRQANYNGYYFDGYLADVFFIDGQALTPSSFTEVSATTGQLIPKAYSGSFGTNGFWLKFSDNSAATATTLGKDYSGNSNNWTPNNLSVTAGTGNDSLVDTPTSYGTDTGAGGEVRGNYCTLNPLGTAGATPTNGNLSVSSSSTVGNRISTFFLTSGKWYWEGSGNGYVATIVGRGGEGFTGSVSATGSKAIGWWPLDGVAYWDGGNSGSGTTYSSTDVIGVALDMDAGTVKFYKNNTLIHNLTFGSGTVPNFSTGVFPGYNVGAGTTSVDINFGQRQWAYQAPAGFKALCDTNLPAPVVAKPSTVMDVKLYTGNGSTQTISGLGFSPDLVWIKDRTLGASHFLHDAVRGTGKTLFSNLTNAEVSNYTYGYLSAFNSDGFTVQAGSVGNDISSNTAPYVAWTWDAGTTTSSNGSGSITSSVRANASAGFSIVTYSGNSSTATVGHGLNVAPSWIIIKNRTSAYDWIVYANESGTLKQLYLNLTLNASSSGLSLPSSTTFNLPGGGASGSNETGKNYVAYCFAPVAGYSSFGSYTGNASADGPFVFCGFRPRWLLFKNTTGSGVWVTYDTARDTYNAASKELYPNLSDAEFSGSNTFDILSNGFKIRTTSAGINTSANTYIYAAFAENPFQYARAR